MAILFVPLQTVMGKFILTSDYQPTGDQPEAIRQLTEGLERGDKSQVLLGVTGSGKTFTMANVIANRNRPTLILSLRLVIIIIADIIFDGILWEEVLHFRIKLMCQRFVMA